MNLDFNQIKGIPQLIKDFLNGSLPTTFPKPFSYDAIAQQIEVKEQSFSPEVRKTLQEVLGAQLEGQEVSTRQRDNLLSLKDAHTFTITTGHQLNLFTGPVFFIYKILQTIKTTEELKQRFPTKNFVPIFWMATEDHDFDEIDHFKTENEFYQIHETKAGAVGRITIKDQLFISEFEREFKDYVFGTELILMMREAYAVGNTFTEATRILGQFLFADYGLLMLDGDDQRLKAFMIPTFKKELLNEELLTTTKDKRSWIEAHYHKVQVNPRNINLFYLTETRNRIEKQGDKFRILDTPISFSESQILEEIERYPERFSPNAVMRPIYQESILPNLAYIGGNAEIMYWLELPDYFAALDLPFPVLIPRNSMLFLSNKLLSKIERLDLEVDAFFDDFSQVINRALTGSHPLTSILDQQKHQLERQFHTIKEQAKLTDISFKNLVEAEEIRQLKSFDRMKKRLLRAEKIKQSEKVQQYERLFLEVHPGGVWQERQYNFSVFFANEGRDWLETCYKRMNVEKSEMIISH